MYCGGNPPISILSRVLFPERTEFNLVRLRYAYRYHSVLLSNQRILDGVVAEVKSVLHTITYRSNKAFNPYNTREIPVSATASPKASRLYDQTI